MPIAYYNHYSTTINSQYYYPNKIYVVRWMKLLSKQQIDWLSPEAEVPHLTSADIIKEVRISASSYKELLNFVDRHVIRELGKKVGKVIDIREESSGWYC